MGEQQAQSRSNLEPPSNPLHEPATKFELNRLGSRLDHQIAQLQSRSDLDQPSSPLKEPATKLELNRLGTRLDHQIAFTDASVKEGLQEQRERNALELQGLRVEL